MTRQDFQLSGLFTLWRGLLPCVLAALSLPALALDPDKRFHDYVKDTWSIEEGLPQITALAIAQDGEGFIWVGTQAGVARFDGNRFTTFTPENTPELSGLYTHDLFRDSRDRLWIASYKGLTVYKDREFSPVPLRELGSRSVSIDVREVAETRAGRIVVAALEGLFEVDNGELVPLSTQLPGQQAHSLLVEKGDLLVGGIGVVARISDGTVTQMPLPDGESSASVTRLVKAQGRLWAGTSHGLFWRNGGEWEQFDANGDIAHLPVGALYEDSDQNLWAGTHRGLSRIRDGRQVEFIEDTEDGAHPNVRVAFEDHEGNLWLGSQWEGVARLWDGWTRRYSAAQGLHDPIVWSLTPASGGGIWVGTNRGLARFENETFEQVLAADKLPHPSAYTLHDDGERLWIGTRTGLAWYRNGEVTMPRILDAVSATQVSGIIDDSAGNTWLAANNGVYRYRDGELLHVGPGEGLVEPRARVLFETSNSVLLVGTQQGLFEIRSESAFPVGVDNGLPRNIDVTAINELADGSLVIGTLSEELFLLADGEWTRITAGDGLPTNSPFFLVEDARGKLWVAGIRGLFSVPVADLHDFRSKSTDSVSGEMLLSERGDIRGSQKAFCCNGAGNAKGFMRDHVLWLPTRDGIIAVDTRDIVRNQVPPEVLVERMRFDNAWHHLQPGKELVLPSGSRDVTFEFTALSYQQPDSVQIRYRLNGYDQEWQWLENIEYRSATYTNLPPGEFVFEVDGSNNAGVWAEQPAVLPFTVAPYFYETLWFRLLVAASILLLVYGGHRYQVRHLEGQRRELEQRVRRRTEELRVANRDLQEMTFTDPLTGLKNRRYLQSQLPADLAFYEREVQKPGNEDLVIMFALVDIDHFKQINDEHGHHAGDLILEQFSKLLHDQVRTGDYVVRWGGEEFLVIFRPMPQRMTSVVAERIRGAIEARKFEIDGSGWINLTASIGFVEYPKFGSKQGDIRWEDLVELADHALYYVKSHGRNGWAVLRPTADTDNASVVAAVREDLEGLQREGAIEIVAHH
ncbi:MAG: diguanylate cyclase [Gammaproteobacteria bacterium]|nr:diguanylate cyclase [Gammaproteobacteria bacterium]